jgi:hypothetical protein
MGFNEHITEREIMAKKSKSSVKAESKVSGDEETIAPVTEFNALTPKGGIIDFYYLFGGIGVLLGIIMIIDILLHYVLHII